MENNKSIKVLIIDDDEEDFLIAKEIISEIKNQEYILDWAPTYQKALNEIKNNCHDVYLIDYKLGAKTGLDLIDETIEISHKIPIIMLTSLDSHETDVLAMKKGAADFLRKGKIDSELLERSIRYAIEKKTTENKIVYLAYYDQVTDLPNRVFFKEQLNYAIAHAARYNRILAILFIDLDNFKIINDSLGHHVGDIFLKEVAKRLHSCIRKSDIIARNSLKTPVDTLARLGGDEFTISLTEINTGEDASLVAGRIIKTLSEPFNIENHEIFTSASIGIALCPTDSDDTDTLLKYADNAMYHVKNQGKNGFQYFQKAMNENVQDMISKINNIRKALDHNEFLLYYQPKMNLKTGEITGFEALIRWDQKDKGIVSPIAFIPFAEKHHLIDFVSNWVLHAVCKQHREWEEANLKALPVSINLPVTQFLKADFMQYITGIIGSYHVSPELFELEITESIFMDEMKSTYLKLSELQTLGFQISIDDFGTGFSSLSRLKQIPCNVLKIDKSFINNINGDSPDMILINSVIAMAHGFKMQVVAEGVETALQFTRLKQSDCDILQGYLLSRPLPKEEIPIILKKESERDGIGMRLIQKLNDCTIKDNNFSGN